MASILIFVRNIPSRFRSRDLRHFFEEAIEAEYFDCFHFKHRPDISRSSNTINATKTTAKTTPTAHNTKKKDICCCLIKVKAQSVEQVFNLYQRKIWIDEFDQDEHGACVVLSKETSSLKNNAVLLRQFQELNPSSVFPNGNVGTTKAAFLKLVQQCKLPASIVGKLGLKLHGRRKRRYGNVPFVYKQSETDFDNDTAEGELEEEEEEENDCTTATSGKPHNKRKRKKHVYRKGENNNNNSNSDEEDSINQRGKKTKLPKLYDNLPDGEGDELSDAEEWERYESLHAHEDITGQERNKERLFEEDVTFVWEKGGSGLVFGTDATYWDREEGGFDEKTTGDLDVDVNGYYESYKSDEWRTLEQLRSKGHFHRGRYHDNTTFEEEQRARYFADLHKGVGSRLLQSQGWKLGEPLGCADTRQSNLSEPLNADGQTNKRGLGYHGEKLSRGGGGGRGRGSKLVHSNKK